MPLDNLLPGQSSESFPSIQEKNLQHLIKVLGTKQATDALREIGDVDKETWKNIKDSIIGLNEFISLGGISSVGSQLKDVIELQFDAFLAPLKNELNQLLIDAFGPILEKLTPLMNDLAQFIADNPTGAIVGGVVGLFLPGGQVTTLLMAIFGSLLQEFLQSIMGSVGTIEPGEDPNSPVAMMRYYEETGRVPQGFADQDYLTWWMTTYHQEWI